MIIVKKYCQYYFYSQLLPAQLWPRARTTATMNQHGMTGNKNLPNILAILASESSTPCGSGSATWVERQHVTVSEARIIFVTAHQDLIGKRKKEGNQSNELAL